MKVIEWNRPDRMLATKREVSNELGLIDVGKLPILEGIVYYQSYALLLKERNF